MESISREEAKDEILDQMKNIHRVVKLGYGTFEKVFQVKFTEEDKEEINKIHQDFKNNFDFDSIKIIHIPGKGNVKVK